jgi:hypothetical protein
MARFYKKKAMVKRGPKKAPRRRLQLTPLVASAARSAGTYGGKRLASAAFDYAKKKMTKLYKPRIVGPRQARANYQNRLSSSDNITTAKAVIIGKPRSISFSEKVARVERPPLFFKRQFAFSAECVSGRKGWFSMEINSFNANDVLTDITSYKTQYTTDTNTSNPYVLGNSVQDFAQFYIDKLSEKIQMINSSSNSVTGKIHLFAQKRDNDNTYQGATPITPINMMMLASQNALPLNVVGQETTIGNGWAFGITAGNTNYNGVYNMPGSSINASGFTASTDLLLSPSSSHVKDRINFWFRKVATSSFSLKPGQQFNSSYVFNDLPVIHRDQQEFIHVAGTSYSLVVEFQAGIVGDSTALSSAVSTGTGQLSVVREYTRILGLKNVNKSKVVMVTAPLATIADANQVIINPDTGVSDTGVDIDN